MRFGSILILCVFLLVPFSVISVHVSAQDKINIVATIEVYASIAKIIGGDFVRVDYILPSGASPHDYSLTTDDILKAQSADLLIFANSEFFTIEENLLKHVEGKPYLDFQDYQKYNVTLLTLPSFGVNYHGYWIYPDNALAIGKAIHATLILLDPDHAKYYDDNLEYFIEKITRIKSIVYQVSIDKQLYGAGVVISVPGVAYIASTFGFNIIASLLKEPGKFMNSTELNYIISLARENKVRLILCPYSLKSGKPGEISRQLSEDAEIPVAYVRIFSMEGLNDYFAMMTYNIGVIENTATLNPSSISSDIVYWYMIAIGVLFAIVMIESSMIFLYKRRAEAAWHE